MTAKIRIKVGDIEIDFEGAESFLDKKLPELISRLSQMSETRNGDPEKDKVRRPAGDPGTLAAFLRASKAGSTKTKRFLATAAWLHRKGSARIRTNDVTKALKDNSQSSVGNASQCLNDNVGRGHCEKDGKQFYVTDEGRATLN
jgi:hypothetical protein